LRTHDSNGYPIIQDGVLEKALWKDAGRSLEAIAKGEHKQLLEKMKAQIVKENPKLIRSIELLSINTAGWFIESVKATHVLNADELAKGIIRAMLLLYNVFSEQERRYRSESYIPEQRQDEDDEWPGADL
jgi:hypothetical protein